LAHLYAPFNRPILLVGGVGSGKTHLAEQIHRFSRRSGPLVVVPAGELSEALYSDTLFGHLSGAYTGATTAREGVIERGSEGTVVFDDLAVMSIAAQAALLRVIESGRFRPLGSSAERSTTARFIFATTVELRALVARADLLPDLASRVGELVIRVPALSERREDIVGLALVAGQEFLREHHIVGEIEITPECEELLLRYPWPGGVRELRGVIERAVIHSGVSSTPVVLRPGHLPDQFHEAFRETDGSVALTRGLVESVLRETAGNQSEAARRLGVHRNTIARWAKSAG